MLDYDLIKENCSRAAVAIDSLWPTANTNLWLVKDLFSESILDKLEHYIQQTTESDWSKVAGQEHLPRHKITWQMDSVVEELHDVCNSLTLQLCQRFDRSLRFNGLQIWRDTEGYYFGKHTDDPKIDTSLQIYVFDAPSACGTTFFVGTGELTLGFFHNTGYLCTSHNLPHKTTTKVPPGAVRYSLYAHWCVD